MLSNRGRPRKYCLGCRLEKGRRYSREWKRANPDKIRLAERRRYHLAKLVEETGMAPTRYMRRLADERARSTNQKPQI